MPTEVSPVAVDEVVLGMWKALSNRGWEAVKTFLASDCIYVDMPVGLESLAGYENHDGGVLVSNGLRTGWTSSPPRTRPGSSTRLGSSDRVEGQPVIGC